MSILDDIEKAVDIDEFKALARRANDKVLIRARLVHIHKEIAAGENYIKSRVIDIERLQAEQEERTAALGHEAGQLLLNLLSADDDIEEVKL